MITLLIVAGAVCFWGFKSGDSRSFQIAKNLDIFNSIVKELDMFYVDTIDPNKTIREGIDAMLYSLDPYTEYYPEDDQSELEQMLKNSYGGIGSVITWNPKLKRSMISEPYENMPAADVGLKAGDILMEIDGKDLAGKNNQEVSEMLRGQVGTSFKLKVQRPGTEKPLDFDIVRRSIQLPFIPYYTVLDNNIGYINLSTFSGNPSKEFKQAYGCFTARIDMPKNGNGNAAFWMMTTDGDRYIKNPAMPSQSNGEIDIVEYFGTWKNRWSAALHWFAWNPNYLCSSGDDKLPAEDIQKGYHNFSAVWTDSAIYWYYDGELARVYEGDGVAKGSAGMRLLIQLAPEYKDGWGGTYDPTDYPYQMKTDYIKAYQFK